MVANVEWLWERSGELVRQCKLSLERMMEVVA